MIFERRADELIDISGFGRITEKVIWQAVENTGVPYVDWTALKEAGEKPMLHLYLELKIGANINKSALTTAIFDEIKKHDERVNSASIYDNLVSIVGGIPINVHIVKTGTFEEYTCKQKVKETDPAHLKPSHINPDHDTLSIFQNYEQRERA